MPDSTFLIAGALAAAGAAIGFLAELKEKREHHAFCTTAARAEGVVSRISERGHATKNERSEEEKFEVPIVRFRAADGAEYEFDAPHLPRTLGMAVEVAYDPVLPSNARPLQRQRRSGCAIFLAALALILIANGMIRD